MRIWDWIVDRGAVVIMFEISIADVEDVGGRWGGEGEGR